MSVPRPRPGPARVVIAINRVEWGMAKPAAVILGAGPGIGLATARAFHAEGFRVGLVGRPGDPLEAWSRELDGAPVLGADAGRAEPLQAALETLRAALGWPEALVWNASAGAQGPVAGLTPEAALADLQVNVLGPLAAVRWALPAMRAAGHGTLLFTGGGLALQPKAGLASASLGKAALRSLALSFAEELAPDGIHAATVTVRGFVQPGSILPPERIAQCFLDLHRQPRGSWDKELVLP